MTASTLRSTRLAAALAALNVAAAAHAQTILYVDDDAPSGGDGRTWDTAFNDLQDALADVRSEPYESAEVRIAAGLYLPDRGTLDRGASFEPRPPSTVSAVTLWLLGGFAGRGASDPNERDPDRFVSVLTGDLKGDDGPGFLNYDDNAHCVVAVEVSKPGLVLSGLTIRGANNPDRSGGGLYVSRNGVGAPFIMDRCTVERCRASKGGGGTFYDMRRFEIRDCTFRDNQALRDYYREGGGAMIANSEGIIERCRFERNTAGSGGGMSLEASQWILVSHCVFGDNLADGTDEFDGGGGVHAVGRQRFVNCLFKGNIAAKYGGGLRYWIREEEPLYGNTFTGNLAPYGGAIAGQGLPLLWLVNSVVHDNFGLYGWQIYGADLTRIAYSTVEGGAAGIGPTGSEQEFGPNVLDADPLFRSSETGDYRLSPGSPCIDSGTNEFVTTLGYDLAVAKRLADDPATPDTGFGTPPIVDMSAYEFTCSADYDGSGRLDIRDFTAFQSDWRQRFLRADFDRDGDFDVNDFIAFQAAFRRGC